MRKKVLISILTIVLITLLASTALAGGSYNGRCLRFFTTDATALHNEGMTYPEYLPCHIYDDCEAC